MARKKKRVSADPIKELCDDKLKDYEVHGFHWDTFIKTEDEDEFFDKLYLYVRSSYATTFFKSHYFLYKEGTAYFGVTECSDTEGKHNETTELEEKPPIVVHAISMTKTEDNETYLATAFPFVLKGVKAKVCIEKIIPWSNLIEGWIVGKVLAGEDENNEECWHYIAFYDASFGNNKLLYKVGEVYTFVLGILCDWVTKGKNEVLDIRGMAALQFYVNKNMKVKYEKDGSVAPVHFNYSELCPFIQTVSAPEALRFYTTTDEILSVSALDEKFWTFDTKVVPSPGYEKKCLQIPTFVRKTKENEDLYKEDELEGCGWISGYLEEEEE